MNACPKLFEAFCASMGGYLLVIAIFGCVTEWLRVPPVLRALLPVRGIRSRRLDDVHHQKLHCGRQVPALANLERAEIGEPFDGIRGRPFERS